ncbi:hypothetical protein LPAF129_07530 [Ligilactobacillus pabuli]|uniref:Acetyl-CoA carboxylase n=1 Tax=Ligilactobacillus pabuli TaxID=2886039 RepID=A0ABQ5JG72_9LACO|nr:hypothetical protein [Ligilactobacillus pabuli]GKS81068.1 hypothetical protein LPAF129_07530 [Ligilactobacillus pabuli]
MQTAHQQVDVMEQRINQHFKPHIRARYQIQIVNDKFDRHFNFFFLYKRGQENTHSVPIRVIQEYDWVYFEEIVTELHRRVNFTLRFTGFQGEIWQSNGRDIPAYW